MASIFFFFIGEGGAVLSITFLPSYLPQFPLEPQRNINTLDCPIVEFQLASTMTYLLLTSFV